MQRLVEKQHLVVSNKANGDMNFLIPPHVPILCPSGVFNGAPA